MLRRGDLGLARAAVADLPVEDVVDHRGDDTELVLESEVAGVQELDIQDSTARTLGPTFKAAINSK